MGHSSRRSRSRSRSDSRERGSVTRKSKSKSKSKSKKSDKKKSSSSSTEKGGKSSVDPGGVKVGRSRSRSRSDSRERRGGKVESSSSSRRGSGDRERDRHSRDYRDRDRARGRDRDWRHRDRARDDTKGGGRRDERNDDGGKDRKRYRSGDGRRHDGDDGRGRGEGESDEMWKRKLRDEDEQLKEVDVDSLMVDEEEEERRLEEQRRKRKEKLEALQRRKKAEEAAAAAAAAAAATAAAAAEASLKASPASDSRGSPSSSGINGDATAATKNGSGHHADPDSDDDDDDDAGPIEITKQASQDNGHNDNDKDDHDDDDDESGARNEAGGGIIIPGETKKRDANGTAGTKATTGGVGGDAEGVSSSELRAQQGKEDRPVFDMFSAAAALPVAGGPGGKMGGKGGGGGAHGMSFLGEDGGGDQANWTDAEGYYKTRVGEVIGGRYTVLGSVGQGVFSTVLKCLDTRAGPAAVGGASEVALKMIRNNDTMRKAAQKEVSLLKELAEHDPANKKHCIRLLSSLEHKQHVVMVFESMQMNLRETLKKFGRKTGINIHAVQKYGKQLMAALKHMASRNLVHADIKPDNILVDQGFGSLKLADFGSAFRETDPDNDPTPYLVSRWYRAPEIVMGLDYDKAIDLWSVAVTLFELYKGSPVLPGVNNNEMLKRMMEFKGPVPARMVKNHMRAFETMGGIRPHFTEGGQFMQQEPDPVTGQTTVRLVTVTAPSRPIKGEIMRSKGAQDRKDTVADLADFLDKCMSLDPRQRMSLAQCSAHSFLRRV